MMKKETWKTVIQIIVQYIDGNRDLAGSNQLHEVKGKKVGRNAQPSCMLNDVVLYRKPAQNYQKKPIFVITIVQNDGLENKIK